MLPANTPYEPKHANTPDSDPTKRSFLDVSNSHLSPETCEWLDAQLADNFLRASRAGVTGLIAGGKTRSGWFVYAPEEPTPELPADLARVCAYARTHGADYVLFDCDAPLNRDLPVLHPDFLDE